jgi:DNA/RNA endonuclease YhcR with UshA esterase domain
MHQRFLTLATLTSIAGLILLSIASSHLNPGYTELSTVSMDMLEENIHVQAPVCEIHEFTGGSRILTLCRANSRLEAYLPYSVSQNPPLTITEGDVVDVIGTVSNYEGRMELVVNRPEDIKIIK